MSLKKVLIFTYYWPPASGPGVQRFLKFSKFLSQFGWEPIIITVKDGGYPYTDDTLFKDIDSDLKVYRTSTNEPFTYYNFFLGKKGKSVPVALAENKDSQSPFQRLARYVRANYFIPDARIGWKNHAIKEADKIIKEQAIDAIITTSPPNSSHLIGLELKHKYGLPWLMDLRDPWTNLFFNKFLPRSAKTVKKDCQLENECVSQADGLTVISNGLKKEFEDRNSSIFVIPNGFDQEDIKEFKVEPSSHFTLAYIGNYKSSQDVPELFDAIRELVESSEEFAALFRLEFVGNINQATLDKIKLRQLERVLKIQGFVSHQEATLLMQQCSLLLFVIPNVDNNKLIMTGKIFEYLASRAPMLSIGPVDGDAAITVKEADRDNMIDYKNKEEIKTLISHRFNEWKGNNQINFKHPKENLNRFSRMELTKELANVLDKICAE